ncbi:MAG: hypothetical protein ABW000_16770 [Actinoplanes sp.]
MTARPTTPPSQGALPGHQLGHRVSRLGRGVLSAGAELAFAGHRAIAARLAPIIAARIN